MSDQVLNRLCQRVEAPVQPQWTVLAVLACTALVLFAALRKRSRPRIKLVCVNAPFSAHANIKKALGEHMVPCVDVWEQMAEAVDAPLDENKVANTRAMVDIVGEFSALSFEQLTRVYDSSASRVVVLLGSLSLLQLTVQVLV
jgi:hypothetical protein